MTHINEKQMENCCKSIFSISIFADSNQLMFYAYEEVKVDKKLIKNGTAITFNLRKNCLVRDYI